MMKQCHQETRLGYLIRVAIAHICDHAPDDVTEYDETECDGSCLAQELEQELAMLPPPEPNEPPPCPRCHTPLSQRGGDGKTILECKPCGARATSDSAINAYRHLKDHLARTAQPKPIYHVHLGKVTIDDQCRRLQERNADPSSTFVVHQGDIKEVTTALLQDHEPKQE